MMAMISFEVQPNNMFHLRAAGIVLHEGKVLFQKPIDQGIWYLPGGRIEYFETAETTLKREMIEEFGIEIVSSKFIWMVENLLQDINDGSRIHEVGLYHLVEFPADHPILCVSQLKSAECRGHFVHSTANTEIYEFTLDRA